MVLANFQLLLIMIIIGQGPTMLAVGTGRGCWDNFLISSIDDIVSFFFSLFLEDGSIFKQSCLTQNNQPIFPSSFQSFPILH